MGGLYKFYISIKIGFFCDRRTEIQILLTSNGYGPYITCMHMNSYATL